MIWILGLFNHGNCNLSELIEWQLQRSSNLQTISSIFLSSHFTSNFQGWMCRMAQRNYDCNRSFDTRKTILATLHCRWDGNCRRNMGLGPLGIVAFDFLPPILCFSSSLLWTFVQFLLWQTKELEAYFPSSLKTTQDGKGFMEGKAKNAEFEMEIWVAEERSW